MNFSRLSKGLKFINGNSSNISSQLNIENNEKLNQSLIKDIIFIK